jgi:hypothetical protein
LKRWTDAGPCVTVQRKAAVVARHSGPVSAFLSGKFKRGFFFCGA